MAVTHIEAVRNGIADYVVDLLEIGSGAGELVIRETPSTAASPGAEVATLTFQDPAFGAATGGVATRSGSITSDSSATGGTAAFATMQDSNGVVVAHCSVTAVAGGGDIELSTLTIGALATVSMSTLTYTAPA